MLRIAEQTGVRPLEFWMMRAGLLSHLVGDARPGVLGQMTADEFATALRLMGRTIHPVLFVHPSHLPALIDARWTANLGDDDLVEVVTAILAVRPTEDLTPVIGRVYTLNMAAEPRLAAGLPRSLTTDSALTRAVAERLNPAVPAWLLALPTD